MEKYIFFVLGMVLGVAISLYVYSIKKERVFKRIKKDQDNFSTAKLDSALEKAVQQMQRQMNVVGRKLTEYKIIISFIKGEKRDGECFRNK